MMKKIKFLFVMMFALVLSNAFVSCDKDSEPNAPKQTKSIDNPELVAKLKALGFQVEGDVLTIDDKVTDVTSLDLSGAKLSNLTGLELFPKLEEVNLSNNNFGDTFDFAGLPENVKSVNLADNDLFQFKGLATVTDDGFTLQKDLKKLVLPGSARFNVDLLPYYYKETKGKTTLQMQNPETKAIEDYTTLRNIPDETLRKFLKENFSSIMKGEQVDLLAPFDPVQSNTNIQFYYDKKINNLEGIQYIVNNLGWKAVGISILSSTQLEIPYLKINKSLQILILGNVNTPHLDLSSAEALKFVQLTNNPSIKVLDLSPSKIFMKKKALEQLNTYYRHSIVLVNCPNLEEIKIADDIMTQYLYEVTLVNLPKLKEFDMSKLEGILNLSLGMIPNTKLTLPKKLSYNIDNDKWFDISITEDMATNPQVKDFIMEYGEKHILGPKWRLIEDYYDSKIKCFDYLTEWNIVLE